MKERKSRKNILMIVTAVAALAVVALWQFYVFATFKNAAGIVDIQGGAMHLWWAVGFTLTACVSVFIGLSFLVPYDRTIEMHITAPPYRRTTVL